MNELQLIREQVSTERRHMAEVKNACGTAIERGIDTDTGLDEFCQACADYLVFILGRFNAQDQAHCELLRPRLAPDDAANRRILDDLEETLQISRGAIARLAAALDARRAGHMHAPEFVGACRDYVAFFNDVLSRRRHVIYHLFDRHYGVEDWRRASFVDADSILDERARYAHVRSKLPPGIELYSPGPPG
jgi:hypothetical protein